MTALLALVLASTYARPEMLVETEWLARHLDDPALRIVDMRRNGDKDYVQGHIPGALNLANDAIRDPSNAPTFLPSEETFGRTMGGLGIGNNTRVVVYDERGGLYAARLWWILNYFGHSDVALLNGGWVKWSKEGRPVSTDLRRVEPLAFSTSPAPRWLATASDVLDAIDKAGHKIIDARTPDEIEGKDLRGIKRGGFIPSSTPFYWEDALDPEWKTIRPAGEIEKLLQSKGLRPSDAVIAYCQVGMRASHDLFVLHLMGWGDLRNYYGAWEEWGNRDDLPLATVSKPDRERSSS